jgi:hypothetical protein
MRLLVLHAATLLMLLLTGCPEPVSVQTVQLDAPVVTPRTLDFGARWLAQTTTRTLTLQNPNRLAMEIALRTEAPFSGSTVIELAPGAEREVSLTFTPTVAGLAESTLTVTTSFSSEAVELRGTAKVPPECRATGSCRVSTFDFDAGTCLERDADEGTDCRAALPCFRTAICSRGECVGAQTTCDDADPCTLDVCTEAGCGHVDDSLSCPATTSLCLAPVCAAPNGCGTTPVVDGTPCGTRTCSAANVCLGGQCLTRPAPQTQACTEVVAGWPAGAGFVDGIGEDARFPTSGGFAPAFLSLAYRSDGLLFVCDGSTMRTVSPTGEVKTIAGVPGEFGLVNGFGRAARLNQAHVIGVDERDNAIIAEGGDRSRAQHALVLRKVSAQGLVSSWVGARCSGSEPDGGVGAGACLGSAMAVGQTRAGDVLLATRVGSWGDWRADRIDRRGKVSFVATYEVERLPGGGLWSWPVLGEDDTIHVCWSSATEFDRGVDGGLLVGCRSKWSWEGLTLLRRRGEQRDFVVGAGPAPDGPVSDAGLSWGSYPIAEDRDGGLAIADVRRFHLRRVENGFIRTLAGPSPRAGLVDGSSALLSEAPRHLTARGGVLFFLDGTRVRSFDPAVGVATVYEHSRRCEGLSVFGSRAVLCCGSDVLVFDDFASAPRTLRVPGFSAHAPFESIAVLPDGGVVIGSDRTWTLDESDGGWVELAPEWFPVLRNTSRGLVGLAGDFRRLVLPGRDGGTTLATLPMDFQAWDFAEAPDGTFIVTHGMQNRILRVTPFTSGTEVPLELSDQATSVAFTADGGLFFGVPNAVLRATLR